jgi:trans-2,3-dihydro-3-hydroxyanthranilate isomerase
MDSGGENSAPVLLLHRRKAGHPAAQGRGQSWTGEAGLAQALTQLLHRGRVVTRMVVAVESGGGPGPGQVVADQSPARSKHADDLAERAAPVPDVVEHQQRQHRIEAGVAEGQGGRIGGLDRGSPREGGQSVPGGAEHGRIHVGGGQTHAGKAGEQDLGIGAGAGPQLEYVAIQLLAGENPGNHGPAGECPPGRVAARPALHTRHDGHRASLSNKRGGCRGVGIVPAIETPENNGLIPPLPGWRGTSAEHRYFVCDVFTSVPLAGNQLAVYTDGRPLDDEQMQRMAREMNIAETVFLLPARQGGDVAVRIFTPTGELPFAGHPVLGTAVVVGTALDRSMVTLETGAGNIPVALERDDVGRIVFGRMQQPVPVWEPFDRQGELLGAIGVERSELPVEVYRIGPLHVCVNLPTENDVAGLRPDLARLEQLGVAANCFAGGGREWKTRMFFPAMGINEDPATGSAAGPLAVHLARHGRIAFGQEITIRQGEEIGRPSILRATAYGSGETVERVEVGGQAVIVAEGAYRISV